MEGHMESQEEFTHPETVEEAMTFCKEDKADGESASFTDDRTASKKCQDSCLQHVAQQSNKRAGKSNPWHWV